MKSLVAGDTGIIGRHLVRYLSEVQGQQVVGISRTATFQSGTYHHVSGDLLDQGSIAQAIRQHTDISHVYYVARSPRDNGNEEADINCAMLTNTVNAARNIADIEHVHLMEGMKWYGSHLGPWKTPAREDDPRHIPPNMYYAQEDWLVQDAARYGYTWSALRPHQVCGYSDVYPHNAMGVIAVYGTLCRELKLPLYFPGTDACFDSISMVTDADLLARAMYWCTETPGARNRALNISNGDYFRWRDVWPLIAAFFAIPAGPVKTLNLEFFMADKCELWHTLSRQHGLRQASMDQLVNWRYGDFTFRAGWDDMASTTALRQAGFMEFVDTHEMFIQLLKRYQAARVIP